MTNALIVVDMLIDFIRKNGKLPVGPTAEAIIAFVKDEVEEHRHAGDLIIWLCDAHTPDDLEFKRFPDHAVAGTSGADIISELDALIHINAGNEVLIPKTRYSGFYNTTLAVVLEQAKPEATTVVGVCTSICVMDTVGGLANRDYPNIIVPKKAVADFDQDAHNAALKRMEALYGANII